MTCPSCHQPLAETTHEDATLHACSGCGGMFLRHAALRAALTTEQHERSDDERRSAMSTAGSPADAPADTRAKLACPECGSEMRRSIHAYSSGVWTDACDEHGIWLDAGELQRLEAWSEASRRGGVGPVDPTSRVGTALPRIASDDTPGYTVMGGRSPREFATDIAQDAAIDAATPSLNPLGMVTEAAAGIGEVAGAVVSLPSAIADFRESEREHEVRAAQLLAQAEAEASRGEADSTPR